MPCTDLTWEASSSIEQDVSEEKEFHIRSLWRVSYQRIILFQSTVILEFASFVCVWQCLLQRVAQGLAQQLQNQLTLKRSLTNSTPNLECFPVIVSTE